MPVRRDQLSEDVPTKSTKDPCRLATTATHGLSGLADIDGETPVAGDRILVKNQGTGSQNGIYVADAAGWSRAIDFDESSDADPGGLISVAEGDDNGGTAWQLTTPAPITLDSTALTFEITGRAGADPGNHAAEHLPSGSQPISSATAVGLDADSTSTEGNAESIARSNHTHAIDAATGTNSTVNAGDAAADGSAAGFSKKDHQHAVATGGATSTIEPDDAAAEGDSSNLARENHQHAIVTAAPAQGVGADNTEGNATSFSRSNHDHKLRESGGQDLTLSTVGDGQLVERSGTTLAGTTAVDDNQHGNRSGAALHSAATPSVNGFMSSGDKTKLDALVTPDLVDPKNAVRALENSSDITLSGNQSLGGVTTAPGERVAVFAQSTPTEDGIYVTASPGAWSRSADFAASTSQGGAVIPVNEGTHADSMFKVTNDPPNDVVGVDDLSVLKFFTGAPRGAGAGLVLNGNDLDLVANADGSLVINADDAQVGVLATDAQHGVRGGGTQHADAIASGADGFMTGADKQRLDDMEDNATAETFNQETVTTESIINTDTALGDTLDATPKSAASLLLFLNGIMQRQGVGADYTVVIGTGVITWLASTGTAVNMKTTDTLDAYYVS